MSRVKIEIPKGNPIFEDTIRVSISDINYGNHLSNDAVLRLTHEVRMRLLYAFGFSEMNIGDDTSIIMADAAIQYKNEAYYGDLLTAHVFIDNIQIKSFEIVTKFFIDGMEKKVIAMVKNGIVAFDYNHRKVKNIPPIFIEKIGIK